MTQNPLCSGTFLSSDPAFRSATGTNVCLWFSEACRQYKRDQERRVYIVVRWKSTDISESCVALSSGPKDKPSTKTVAWLILSPWRCSQYVSRKRMTFSGLHGIMFQKTKLFMAIVAETPDPTCSWETLSCYWSLHEPDSVTKNTLHRSRRQCICVQKYS
jgi:hypothetical protein